MNIPKKDVLHTVAHNKVYKKQRQLSDFFIAKDKLKLLQESEEVKRSTQSYSRREVKQISIAKGDEQNVIANKLDPLFEDCDDALFDVAVEATAKKGKLNLSEWKRCRVEAVTCEKETYDIILNLRTDDREEYEKDNGFGSWTAACRLRPPWNNLRIEEGDVVSVIAKWNEQLQIYEVDRNNGFCVTNPDKLISGTSVVGSLFCPRRAVLQERFRGVDANSKVMVIGTIVHRLFQIVLTDGLKTYKAIQAAVKTYLASRELIFMLYGSLMTMDEISTEVWKFVPNIFDFVQQYVKGALAPQQGDLFEGVITDIEDIEENFWLPHLGLKGKVDVVVKVMERKKADCPRNPEVRVIPLELKTGRATFSAEHKGQVLLYQMMMTDTGTETNSGLLLYLREGIMREVSGLRNEQRDLVILRNNFAYYLSRPPPAVTGRSLSLADGKYIQPVELPEPISHHSACKKCPYATICCSFVRTDSDLELGASHPLTSVMERCTDHLKAPDYEYFINWCGLLTLEDVEAKTSSSLSSLFSDPPEVRARNGTAIKGMKLQTDVSSEESRFLHTFTVQTDADQAAQSNVTVVGFAVGEYVIVSTARRLAVGAGFIEAMTDTSISISLERNLLKKYSEETFVVDKHESESGNVFNFTNLGLLLENNEQSEALRAIIVHRRQPTFDKISPAALGDEGMNILKGLNAIQHAAVMQALGTDSFMLIKGLPGTGKTQTLVAIVRLLNLLGKSVLITSHTHSAVDNVMLRLKTFSLPMLRLGSAMRTHPLLREFNEDQLTAKCATVDELAKVYASYNVVGVTCLGSAHSLLLYRRFDVCIVDEATQVMQCTVLRPLYFSAKFILVGDPDQLPPLIRSKEAKARGADESLFKRLDTQQATAVLTHQYRMNTTITKLANQLTYKGSLKCANKEVAAAVVAMPTGYDVVTGTKWLQRAVQVHIDQAVFLLDTGDCVERSHSFAKGRHDACLIAAGLQHGCEVANIVATTDHQKAQKHYSRYTNYCDAAIVLQLIDYFLSGGYDPSRIGVIAPYRAQVELLRKVCEHHQGAGGGHHRAPLAFNLVEVNTVDQFQGRDKDVMIYSCTRTGSVDVRDVERSRDSEILEDRRRLTVAITRAKYKLMLIGDATCLQQYTPFRELLSAIPSYCRLQLQDGKCDFSWESVLSRLSHSIAR